MSAVFLYLFLVMLFVLIVGGLIIGLFSLFWHHHDSPYPGNTPLDAEDDEDWKE